MHFGVHKVFEFRCSAEPYTHTATRAIVPPLAHRLRGNGPPRLGAYVEGGAAWPKQMGEWPVNGR